MSYYVTDRKLGCINSSSLDELKAVAKNWAAYSGREQTIRTGNGVVIATIRNADLTDDWAKRFIRQVQATTSVIKTQVQVPAEKKT